MLYRKNELLAVGKVEPWFNLPYYTLKNCCSLFLDFDY